MIKAIIFDFGNVICNFTNDHLVTKLGKLSGKEKAEISRLIYDDSKISIKYETGVISSDEFHKELSELCNLNISHEDLRHIYTAGKFTPVPGMSNVIKALKSKYKIALLSNTSQWDTENGINLIPEIELFDTKSLSFEVKAMKPHPNMFYDALTKLNLLPQECIYTDDIKDYVVAAQNLGINSIQFIDTENFISSLNEFGIYLN